MREDTFNLQLLGEATRGKKVQKWVQVGESGKSTWTTIAADDELRRKSRKRKKKNKERDFRRGSWDPGGGEEGGEGMRCAQGPPGGRSLPPSPLFLSPPPFPPKGGAHPVDIYFFKEARHKVLHLLKPGTLLSNVENPLNFNGQAPLLPNPN